MFHRGIVDKELQSQSIAMFEKNHARASTPNLEGSIPNREVGFP